MTKKHRIMLFLSSLLILSAIYFGFSFTPLTMPITIAYFVLCLVLSVLYVLVNGGIQPMRSSSEHKKDKNEAKPHAVKQRYRYRRFQSVAKKDGEPFEICDRPNPFKLSEEKRRYLAQTILLILVPIYLIFIADWILLKIFV